MMYLSDGNGIIFEAKQLVEGLPQLITSTVISSYTEYQPYIPN